jgi:hypothetical protein
LRLGTAGKGWKRANLLLPFVEGAIAGLFNRIKKINAIFNDKAALPRFIWRIVDA